MPRSPAAVLGSRRRGSTLPPHIDSEGLPRTSRRRSGSVPGIPPTDGKHSQLSGVSVSVPHTVLQYGRTELVVVYVVEARQGDCTHTRLLRFSEFEYMHRTLLAPALERLGAGMQHLAMVAPAGLSGLPAFPTRSGLFQASTNTSQKAIERRRKELQTYLRRLCAVAHGTPIAPVLAPFLLKTEGGNTPSTHLGHTVVRTRWRMPHSDSALADTILVELPWARQVQSDEPQCVVDAVKFESVSVVQKRFREFVAFAAWVAQDDRVPSSRDALSFLAAWRKSQLAGSSTMRAPLPESRAGTPPTRAALMDLCQQQAAARSAPAQPSQLAEAAMRGGRLVDLPKVVVTPPAGQAGEPQRRPRLRDLSVHELRRLAKERRVDVEGCTERADFITRIVSAHMEAGPLRKQRLLVSTSTPLRDAPEAAAPAEACDPKGSSVPIPIRAAHAVRY
eukprot:TRINITY_DN2657_c0_g1_i1.p1 TRINITY_DN2657_c0_g1~~TRINITY_DN2657_c0_g1_i1.p1  ORF type:complete len:468 (+),score=119.59 TRINITY_DN2657_c0_g1_i1:62-1405(+)